MHNHPATLLIKAGVDVSAFGVAIGSLLGYLPPIAAVLSIVWTTFQIVDWCSRRFAKRHHHHR